IVVRDEGDRCRLAKAQVAYLSSKSLKKSRSSRSVRKTSRVVCSRANSAELTAPKSTSKWMCIVFLLKALGLLCRPRPSHPLMQKGRRFRDPRSSSRTRGSQTLLSGKRKKDT